MIFFTIPDARGSDRFLYLDDILFPVAIYILFFVVIWRWASGVLRALRSTSRSLQEIAASRRPPQRET